MPAAGPRRVEAVGAVLLLSTVLLGGCRSRLRGAATVADEPLGAAVPATGVAPATRAPASFEEADPRIRGRILDELGTPPPATVYVLRWQGDPAEEGPVTDAVTTVPSDANGEFAFDLTSAASKELRIDVAGLAPRHVWVPVDATRSPILMLGTRTLQGFVHDPEGRTVAGALVRVHVSPERGRRGSRRSTGRSRSRSRSPASTSARRSGSRGRRCASARLRAAICGGSPRSSSGRTPVAGAGPRRTPTGRTRSGFLRAPIRR
jgi:hypothetical protein